MTNYSQVFAETLALYESPYVPGDQGDAGKGQVCVRAGYTIATSRDANVGYIAKSPGQTQYYGVAVDALKDKRDGTWADYLTDILQPDGRRLIALAYTPHNEPIAAGTNPAEGWVQLTAGMLDHPGPLTLKSTTPVPGPEPTPPADEAVLAELDEIKSMLDDMRAQAVADKAEVLARDDTNTEKSMQQIRDLVEDVEASLKKAGIALIIHRRRQDGEATP